jgi:hypothetical protein
MGAEMARNFLPGVRPVPVAVVTEALADRVGGLPVDGRRRRARWVEFATVAVAQEEKRA